MNTRVADQFIEFRSLFLFLAASPQRSFASQACNLQHSFHRLDKIIWGHYERHCLLHGQVTKVVSWSVDHAEHEVFAYPNQSLGSAE